MKILSMEDFQEICRNKLTQTYREILENNIDYSNTFIVWSVKALQNFKCLASTTINNDNVYVEYIYNGDKEELYEDFYIKKKNTKYD